MKMSDFRKYYLCAEIIAALGGEGHQQVRISRAGKAWGKMSPSARKGFTWDRYRSHVGGK